MKNRLRLQSVVISSFLRSWINAANPVPQRCHSAHDKNEQRTREIEDKIIHIARARSGVHLQHLHRVMLSVSDAVKKKMLLCQRNSAGRNTPIGANAIRLPARLSTTSRSEILP